MRLFGLIGNPLGHSFSKQYFTQKFEREGLQDCLFELFPLQNISGLKPLLDNSPGLEGLAVTIPYKEDVIPYLDAIDEQAGEIGAVNCIRISSGRLTGYNTDVTGFEQSLLPLLKPQHRQALVLGTGGASKAVQWVLRKLGIEYLIVTRGQKPLQGVISYDTVDEEVIRSHTLIINCTPVGMYPDEDQSPALPYQFIGSDHLLFDLVYRPAETMFLSTGHSYGATIKNGYEMLVLQAEASWKIWNTPAV